jgi:hypothetical protein
LIAHTTAYWNSVMAQEDLDALLSRMEAIAKAVNAFTAEKVQQEAFAALVAAFEGKRHSAKHGHNPAGAVEPEPEQEAAPAQPPWNGRANGGGAKPRRSGKGKTSSWTFLKDLDLHPAGKQSLEDFDNLKQPSSNEDKFAVVVYYLSEIAELPAVGVNHVGSAFRLIKSWREPGDVSASLRITSSRKGTLDTSNLENIKITPSGRNFVEHELPAASKVKKK